MLIKQFMTRLFISVSIYLGTVVLSAFTVSFRPSYDQSNIVSLDGRWNVTNDDHSINIYSTVPGGIYSDLMAANVIPNIYKNFNDVKTRWVASQNWKFSTNFSANGQLTDKKAIFLVFNGVDTDATIFLNNKEVGQTNNMFVRYRFDISKEISVGANDLSVYIRSPISFANKEFELEKAKRGGIPIKPLCTPSAYHGECHVNHIRKQQASFSWDWGPAFPSSGIWDHVYIESYDSAIIRDVETHLTHDPKLLQWTIKLVVHMESTSGNVINGDLTATLHHHTNKSQGIEVKAPMYNLRFPSSGRLAFIEKMVVPDDFVDLWWPNGHGEQFLYPLVVALHTTTEEASKEIQIGFRTVELVQDPIANHEGLTFYFRVNNVPIFMKGSNWIPSNILPEVSGTENGKVEITKLMKLAKLANMNMLRVWGGGVYETDFFYTLADQMGILIWQDFMFACSYYPSSEEFLRNVETETIQQVARLQYHPSIAIWAGNNENEIALSQDWYRSANYTLDVEDYVKLYVNTIKKSVEIIDPSRPFIVSSPSNGKMSDASGYISKNPGDPLFGDCHVYNYYANAWNPDTYPNLRFSSEYGLQSLPNYQTLLEATDNPIEDLQRNSDFMNHRQHHPLNYIAIDLQILMHFPTIKRINLKDYIYQSQIVQAVAMKVETEKYRRLRNTIFSNSQGLTMGALYWQLNDVWQAPSWSSIDFGGRWKMLHYYARNFFAPVLVCGSLTKANLLDVYVVSDLYQNVTNAQIRITVHNFKIFKNVTEIVTTIDIEPQKSLIYHQVTLPEVLNTTSIDDTIIVLNLQAEGVQSPENFVLAGPMRRVKNKPTMSVSVLDQQGEIFQILVKTNSFSPFVWLQTDVKGYFSDNGFMMIGTSKLVDFVSEEKNVTKLSLQDSLHISSLRNTDSLQ